MGARRSRLGKWHALRTNDIMDRSAANKPPPQSTCGTGGHELRRWQGANNCAAVNKIDFFFIHFVFTPN